MEVVAEQFIGHDLVDNILEVRTVDVFMGFHGAGFVNSFYLQPVRRARGHGAIAGASSIASDVILICDRVYKQHMCLKCSLHERQFSFTA